MNVTKFTSDIIKWYREYETTELMNKRTPTIKGFLEVVESTLKYTKPFEKLEKVV
jgi:hypothetical protein